jgi:hypothetical protein
MDAVLTMWLPRPCLIMRGRNVWMPGGRGAPNHSERRSGREYTAHLTRLLLERFK